MVEGAVTVNDEVEIQCFDGTHKGRALNQIPRQRRDLPDGRSRGCVLLINATGRIVITRTDIGIGIRGSTIASLSSPFTQERSEHERSGEALWLGLALAKRHLESSGARLDITS